MKYLFTGVALTALIGLAPAAMAQYSSGAQPGSMQRQPTTSPSGATTMPSGSGTGTGYTGTDTRSTMGGTGTSGSSMGTGATTGTSSGQMRRGGREEDTTRDLNLQELNRVRSGAGG
jgi:hypothetical protein